LELLKLVLTFFTSNDIVISPSAFGRIIRKVDRLIDQVQSVQKGSVTVTRIVAAVDREFIEDVIMMLFMNDRN
jgi:hypothetical protein